MGSKVSGLSTAKSRTIKLASLSHLHIDHDLDQDGLSDNMFVDTSTLYIKRLVTGELSLVKEQPISSCSQFYTQKIIWSNS